MTATRTHRIRRAAVMSAALLLAPQVLRAASNYVGMEFSDLMKIKVTSVELRGKPVSQTAAAVSLLAQEDIRRSGATNLPDLLRMIPGIAVARASGNTWAISSRGGLDPLSNKLLVLIDGRSVYTPLFAGVFWEVQDIPLETIDHIEVIRGPGASVWGSNAVNGVINIIRKHPEKAKGTTASVTAGNEDRFIGNVMTGWKASENTSASVYARYRDFDGMKRVNDGDAGDSGNQGGGGFRLDGKLSPATDWTVSGDYYSGQFGVNDVQTSFTPPVNIPFHDEESADGGNVLTRWSHDMGAAGNVLLQAYWDLTRRRLPRRYTENRNTWDFLGQYQIVLARIHRFTSGVGFRTSHDDVGNTDTIHFDPDSETENITNLFVQDEMQLLPSWSFTIGTKLERNIYTGWEVEPSARTGWEFATGHLLWGSVSRAVRTPSRIDRDLRSESILAPSPVILSASIRGSDDFISERLTAYEIGYRAQPVKAWVLSVSGFYNVYDHLRGVVAGPGEADGDPVAHVDLPFVIRNDLRSEAYGGELGQRIQLASWWQLRATYALLHQRIHQTESGRDLVASNLEGADPQHQVTARSSWNIGPKTEFDLGARWISELKSQNIDDYAAVDARIAFKATKALTFEAVGQNLTDPSHREIAPGNEVQRSFYGKATWTF